MKRKINKNDSIIICVEKFETNKRKKTLYNLLTSYKYIDCLLLNLFNFHIFQCEEVKKGIEKFGFFESVIKYEILHFTNKKKKIHKKKKLTIKMAGHTK